jgi:hypothetical protein
MYKKTPWIRSFKKKAQMSRFGIRKKAPRTPVSTKPLVNDYRRE